MWCHAFVQQSDLGLVASLFALVTTPALSWFCQADLQAQLQDLYQMPRSRAVEDQKAALRRELQALQ